MSPIRLYIDAFCIGTRPVSGHGVQIEDLNGDEPNGLLDQGKVLTFSVVCL